MIQTEVREAIAEAMNIVSASQRRQLVLRALGAVAFKIHCSRNARLYDSMERPITDIDLAGYSSQKKEVRRILQDMGYEMSNTSLMMYENRFIMNNPTTGIHLDVFFDSLDMCHRVDLRNRLELDLPTISVTDLLLEKMQIVKIEPKDIKDTIMLLLEHELTDGHGGRECIDVRHLCQLLSSDWGFHHTFTTNLGRVKEELASCSFIPGSLRDEGISRVERLVAALEECPKTMRWHVRALVGTKRQWYNDVEELAR